MFAASPSSPRFLKLLSADSAKGAAICILADVMHQDDDAAEMPLHRLATVHLRVTGAYAPADTAPTPCSKGPLPQVDSGPGLDVATPDGSTKTVKAVPCTPYATETDGTTTRIGIPGPVRRGDSREGTTVGRSRRQRVSSVAHELAASPMMLFARRFEHAMAVTV
jgi:hypothetical protein